MLEEILSWLTRLPCLSSLEKASLDSAPAAAQDAQDLQEEALGEDAGGGEEETGHGDSGGGAALLDDRLQGVCL